MLDLSDSDEALATYARRFVDSGLPQLPFAAFDRRAYPAAELALGRRDWQQRARDEYRSLASFAWLLDQLLASGAAHDWLGVAVRMVRDEHRHVELSRRMVRALGGADRIPGVPDFVEPDGHPDPKMRVLGCVVGSLCIGETLSVRGLVACARAATDPLAKAVLDCFCADESIHSQAGWRMLGALLPEVSRAQRRELRTRVGSWLQGARRAMAGDAPRAARGRRHAFGSLSTDEARAVYFDNVEGDVLENLRRLGLG